MSLNDNKYFVISENTIVQKDKDIQSNKTHIEAILKNKNSYTKDTNKKLTIVNSQTNKNIESFKTKESKYASNKEQINYNFDDLKNNFNKVKKFGWLYDLKSLPTLNKSYELNITKYLFYISKSNGGAFHLAYASNFSFNNNSLNISVNTPSKITNNLLEDSIQKIIDEDELCDEKLLDIFDNYYDSDNFYLEVIDDEDKKKSIDANASNITNDSKSINNSKCQDNNDVNIKVANNLKSTNVSKNINFRKFPKRNTLNTSNSNSVFINNNNFNFNKFKDMIGNSTMSYQYLIKVIKLNSLDIEDEISDINYFFKIKEGKNNNNCIIAKSSYYLTSTFIIQGFNNEQTEFIFNGLNYLLNNKDVNYADDKSKNTLNKSKTFNNNYSSKHLSFNFLQSIKENLKHSNKYMLNENQKYLNIEENIIENIKKSDKTKSNKYLTNIDVKISNIRLTKNNNINLNLKYNTLSNSEIKKIDILTKEKLNNKYFNQDDWFMDYIKLTPIHNKEYNNFNNQIREDNTKHNSNIVKKMSNTRLNINKPNKKSIEDKTDITFSNDTTYASITNSNYVNNIVEKTNNNSNINNKTRKKNKCLTEYVRQEEWGELENKSHYSGHIKNNLPNGYGKEYRKDGQIYDGTFMNGKWHGLGILTNENLDCTKCEYINGRVVGI